MSSGADWEETTLGAEVDLLTGFPFKSERYTVSADSIPLVRGDNIVQGAMRWDGVKRWPLSERGEHELYELREGDVVLAMDRPWIEAGLKYAAISKHDLPCLLVQRTARLRGGPKLDIGFLRYLIGSLEFTQHIHAITTGTAVPHISARQIKDFAFALPPLAEQKAIAAVLGALDDKIELNRRMNATLEAMARALFQSWFVDFLPVRANMDRSTQTGDPVRAKLDLPARSAQAGGRPPAALDPATAALFPEHLEDSPLGHIPRGWEVRTIESVCKSVTRGVTPEYGEGTGRFIINQRVNRGSDLDWSSLKELSQGLEVPPERFAKRWDVFVNCLGEGTLGRTHLYKGESDIFAIDQHMSICRAEHRAGGAYIYQVLSGADGQAKIESLKTGSTGMTMFNISKLRTFELVWPSAEILAAYFKTVEPLWLQIANNDQESRTLATLRDTLLPKLLSGELSVAGATVSIEASA